MLILDGLKIQESYISMNRRRPFHNIPRNSKYLLHDAAAERLEQRCMLAGFVKVSVTARGDINIRGDSKDNYVEIAAIDTDGDETVDSLRIRGESTPMGEVTQVKVGRETTSETTIPIDGGQVDGKIRISLGGGNDFLRVNDLVAANLFQYNGAAGGNMLIVKNSEFSEDAKFKTGGGNDAIFFTDTDFHDIVDVRTSGGADWVSFSGGTIGGDVVKVNTGGSPDMVSFGVVGTESIAESPGAVAEVAADGGFGSGQTIVDADVDIVTGSFPDMLYLADGTTFNSVVDIDLGSFADALVVEAGVTFNDLANSVLDGNRNGPNYDNAAFIEVGVDLNSIPDVTEYGYVFDNVTDLEAEFNYRAGNTGVNIDFFTGMKTLMHKRGMDFVEMPFNGIPLTNAEMNSIYNDVVVGLASSNFLERTLYKQIFEDDLELLGFTPS